ASFERARRQPRPRRQPPPGPDDPGHRAGSPARRRAIRSRQRQPIVDAAARAGSRASFALGLRPLVLSASPSRMGTPRSLSSGFATRRFPATGGLGFIGSNLVRALVAAGAEVWGVDSL